MSLAQIILRLVEACCTRSVAFPRHARNHSEGGGFCDYKARGTTGGKRCTYYDWEALSYVIIRLGVTSHALRFCEGAH